MKTKLTKMIMSSVAFACASLCLAAAMAQGTSATARSEAAVREELVALALSVPAALFIATETWKRLALVGAILLLIAVELLNTAIEKLSDHVTATHHPDIGQIKDMSSAAVGVALAIAGFAWLAAFAEWLRLI